MCSSGAVCRLLCMCVCVCFCVRLGVGACGDSAEVTLARRWSDPPICAAALVERQARMSQRTRLENRRGLRGRGAPATLCSIRTDRQLVGRPEACCGHHSWQPQSLTAVQQSPRSPSAFTASAGEIAVIQQRPGSLKRHPPHAVPARCPQLQIKSSR
jgi:hypothetical protein